MLKVFKGEDTFRALSEKLRADPDNVPLLARVGRKHENRFQTDKAVPLYERILALDPEGKAGTLEYEGQDATCLEFADFRIAQDAVSRTENPAELLAFAARRPASRLARYAYRNASFYFLQGRTKEEARAFFEDGLAKYPGDPLLTMYYLQRILRDRDNLDRGIALVREAGQYASLADSFQRVGAEFHALKGDLDSAEAAYGPDYVEGRLAAAANALQGYAQFWAGRKKNVESAVKAVELALSLQPDSIYAPMSAAQFYIRAGMTEKADEVYGPAFAEKHKGDAQALANYAAFWARQKKHPERLAAADEAVRLKPENSDILESAAQAYIAWDKKDRALEIYGPSAVPKIGDNALRLNSYAWFWAKLATNLDSALAAAQRSIEIDDREWTQDTLAVVLLGLGRLDEALAAVNRAMAMSSEPSRYQDTERKIKAAIAKKKQRP